MFGGQLPVDPGDAATGFTEHHLICGLQPDWKSTNRCRIGTVQYYACMKSRTFGSVSAARYPKSFGYTDLLFANENYLVL